MNYVYPPMPSLPVTPPPPSLPAVVQSLPALVRRAADTLTKATTAAEILDATAQVNLAYDAAKAAARFARAKGAYDEVIGAVYRSQADALEIEAAAKRRYADEYDAAQERGEVAKVGERARLVVDDDGHLPATRNELGINKDFLHAARVTRDAETTVPGIVKDSLNTIIERGHEPTKSALGREINARLASFSGDNEWYTPTHYVAKARLVMGGIDCDPASNERAQELIAASTYYTTETNGLAHEWHGRVWMNPPYSQPEVQQFADKLLSEVAAGRVTEAVVLTNAAIDTQWHQRLQDKCTCLCTVSGRIQFQSGNGRTTSSNAVGQTFLYFGPNADKFNEVFSAIGKIWLRYA